MSDMHRPLRRKRLLMGTLMISSCSHPSLSFLPAPPAFSEVPSRPSSTAEAWSQRPAWHPNDPVRRRMAGFYGSRDRPFSATAPLRRYRPRMTAAPPGEEGATASAPVLTDVSARSTAGSGAVKSDASQVPAPVPREGEMDGEGKALTLDQALELGVNRAMRGDSGVLRQVLSPGVKWAGPLGLNSGVDAIAAELKGLGELLAEPRMSVIKSSDRGSKLEWTASGTWPLPWRPRFIARGSSSVEIGPDGKVVRISDTWEENIVALALKHLVPGFWDLWHQLGSPPAEQMPYTTLKKTFSYEIREYAPRLVYQPSLIDRSNSRELRMALILPGFAHTAELRTSGRKPEEYYVTAPVEVAIQPFIEMGNFPNGTWFNGTTREASASRKVNRITWTVPVPTAFGMDVAALPPPAKERAGEEGEGQRARHARHGFRRIAVTNFDGLPQDPEATELRATLLRNLASDGVTPSKGQDGRVRSGVLMHNSRGCFNKAGHLAMSILYHRPKFLGIGNEVFVELDDEETVLQDFVNGEGYA